MTEEKRRVGRPSNAEKAARKLEEDRGRSLGEPTGRQERIPLGTQRLKLDASEFVRPGYTARWVNDSPGRLQDAQRAGYEFVRDPGNQRGKEGGICRRVGVNEDKTPLNAYLMEIPDEFYKQDQSTKQRPLDDFDAQLKRGIVKGDPRESDAYYVPDEGIHIKRDGPIVQS